MCNNSINFIIERMRYLKNTNLLNALYQNAEMGTTSIKKLFPKVKDSKLKTEMRTQLNNYSEQRNKLTSMMKSHNVSPEPVSKMIKVMTSTGIALNCAKDSSTEHVAEMLIQGTNMGIIKINQALNRTSVTNSKFTDDAKVMLEKEQKYIDSLKKYL